MALQKTLIWGTAIAAGIIASFAALPQASAELLYDEDIAASGGANDPRTEDRGDMRDALGASHRAQTTLQAQPVVTQTIPVQPMQPSPVQILHPENAQVQITSNTALSAATAESPDVENFSKSELMRRQRMRAEVQNEDILQERLEELRLRDERRRTDHLLGRDDMSPRQSAGQAALTEEVVIAPVTERPGQAVAPLVRQPVVYSDATAPAATLTAQTVDEEKTRIWVQPRAGISQMTARSYFEVVPHFAAGLGAGVEVSDNLGFELGYTFNEYGVRTAQNNFVMYPGAVFESHAMRQNVFEGIMKLYFLSPEAKFRPYLSGGAAYSRSFVNYPDAQLNYFRSIGRVDLARDYESSSFVGALGAGFDVRINKSISIGATFKYYRVLSSRETDGGLSGGYYNPGFYPLAFSDPQKVTLGQQLSVSSFYSILAGASFSF